MKKSLFVTIVALLLILGIGCGKPSDATKAGTPSSKAQVVNEQASGATSTPATTPTSTNFGKAIDFTLSTVDGTPVKLADYAGKVVLLNFWATWCPPCRMEIPHFNDLAKELGPQGLVIVGISVDQGGAQAVRQWMAKNTVSYPVAMDNGQISQQYSNVLAPEERGGIPFTFLIDKQGNIRKTFVGYRDKATWTAEIKSIM